MISFGKRSIKLLTVRSARLKRAEVGSVMITSQLWHCLIIISVSVALLACDDLTAIPDQASAEVRAWRAEADTSPAAQYKLALAYRTGQGVPANQDRALFWLNRAAQGGYAAAQYQLGSYYALQQEYALSIQWLQRAIDQHYAPAYVGLGQLYTLGLGVEQVNGLAYAWIHLAVTENVDDAHSLEADLVERMTLDEFARGVRLYFTLKEQYALSD